MLFIEMQKHVSSILFFNYMYNDESQLNINKRLTVILKSNLVMILAVLKFFTEIEKSL